MILKHVGWSVNVFGSIPKSNFWSVDCTQVSDSGPLGLLFDLLPDIVSDDFLKQTNKKAYRKLAVLLVHLCQRLKCTIVITRCLLSVRPSVVTFHIFDFSETAEQNSTKLDRKQDLNILQVCVFRADQKKKKKAALASDCLRHFWLFLWNPWKEFNKTWQEARS